MDNTAQRNRIIWLDGIRGYAVVLMMVYHFFYDLTMVGWWQVDVDAQWGLFRGLILTLFISVMAVSIRAAYLTAINYQKYAKWLGKMLIACGLVSLVTYCVFGEGWVYFGVLHFMVLASLIIVCLQYWWRIGLLVGGSIVLIHFVELPPFDRLVSAFDAYMGRGVAVDYVPLVPWLGVALISSALAPLVLRHSDNLNRLPLPQAIQFLGRHSLAVYLVHQPIILGFFYGAIWLTH